jgi:NAD(P)-dependent dehydrogenase (short-subunit alcohol dehydrogenase family)
MPTQKTVLITGAGSGIGEACAKQFVNGGARVAALDVKRPAGELADKVFWNGPVDLLNRIAVRECVDAASSALGPIDILINAAGVGGDGKYLDETSEEELDRIIGINLRGALFTSKCVLKSMVARRRGSIVHIASVAGIEGAPGHLPYGASKAGLIHATKTMAWEYGRSGIRVNCICPGLIRTPMTGDIFSMKEHLHQMVHWSAMRRWGEPSEIASAADFLSSDMASFVTGHALIVDGGWTAGRDQIPPFVE